MINVIYEDNHLLVVEKPIDMPVQADNSRDRDFLNFLKEYLKDKYNKPGNVYLGLVHRLDRPVGGIMVFAKTSKASARLSEQIRTHQVEKFYYAVLDGKIKPDKDILKDRLLKNKKTNITKIDPRGKEAVLEYEVIKYRRPFSLVNINLKTGRSHQIRVQFSSRGYPLYGDQKYNDRHIKDHIALYSYKISFYHPINKQKLEFSLPLPNTYPFSIFSNKK